MMFLQSLKQGRTEILFKLQKLLKFLALKMFLLIIKSVGKEASSDLDVEAPAKTYDWSKLS